jgi:hypothetical protein
MYISQTCNVDHLILIQIKEDSLTIGNWSANEKEKEIDAIAYCQKSNALSLSLQIGILCHNWQYLYAHSLMQD